jgi:hypothetical protein
MTPSELLGLQLEQMEEDRLLMEAGYAPGEVPPEGAKDPLMQAELEAETIPEAEAQFQTTTTYYDPFAEYDEVDEGTADYDPFAEYDVPERHGGLANPLVNEFPSDFPMEPGTSRASQELGEMFVPPQIGGVAPQIQKGRTAPATGGGVGETLPMSQQLMISAAALTMTDPEEIAEMLRQYPDDIAVQYAPDGAILATNIKTGARGLVNRPGTSVMDVLQSLGIVATYAPGGSWASLGVKTALPKVASATMRHQMEKQGIAKAGTRMAAASGVTETGVQTGQHLAGGTFDPEDIAFATGAGKAGEHLAKPIARVATKGKELFGKTGAVVPKNVMQALEYAKQTGRKIFTSDAMSDFMTPVQTIAMKVIERIPITGIGKLRRKQKAARTDALVDLVNKYDINIEEELGHDIVQSFYDRLIKQRFWGKNKDLITRSEWPKAGINPETRIWDPVTKTFGEPATEARRAAQQKAQDLLESAFEKESKEIIDGALARQLKEGNLDDEIVERVLDMGIPKRVRDLYDKLLPDGKKAVKKRFLSKGLEKAGWTPDAPQISNPDEFVKYLSDPKNKKMLNIFFDQGEKDLIEGTREYLRMTSAAAKTSAGAGMVAAVGGASAVGLTMFAGLGWAGITAGAGRVIQGRVVRNLLLKLAYAKGNPEKAQTIMQALRPAVMALESQYFEEGGPPELPPIEEFDEQMMKDLGDYGMEYLRSLGDVGMKKIEGVTGTLSEMLN